ncbi:MAG: glutathione peroxidase [Halobacteriovoraceae bacterium]|nr:glutathione peroxidase [Halobacteriovoraceae bacterium]
MDIYDYSFKNVEKADVSMSEYRGKVLLIVNTASQCGLTGQYKGLEKLYEDFKDKGLEVLGFPCNQFGQQEPGTDSEIQEFCQLQFGIKFSVFQKIDVNGKSTHPLYAYLKKEAPGLFGSQAIKWSFTKFLVDRNGVVIKRYSPKDLPESIVGDIEKLLAITS